MVGVVGPLLNHYTSDAAFAEVYTGLFIEIGRESAIRFGLEALRDPRIPESRKEMIAERLRVCKLEPRQFESVRELIRTEHVGMRLRFYLLLLLPAFARTEYEAEAARLALQVLEREPELLDAGSSVLVKLRAYDTHIVLRRILRSVIPRMSNEARRVVERRLESMGHAAAKRASSAAPAKPRAATAKTAKTATSEDGGAAPAKQSATRKTPKAKPSTTAKKTRAKASPRSKRSP